MKRYKVLQYCKCGNLNIDKGQIILVEPHNHPSSNYALPASMISLEHYPDKKQLITTIGVKSMIDLKKIERI